MNNEYTAAMAHTAVERGAAWLDERCPDWMGHIDLDKLDLGDPSACMLGQTAECLVGTPIRTYRYTRVLRHLDRNVAWAEDHGFDVPIHAFVPGKCGTDCNSELRTRYEMLTIAWLTYIRQRVETPA